MYSKTVKINMDHSYQIPEFVQLACKFNSKIIIRNNHSEFDAKSIMGMMSLDPNDGPIFITATGDDEEKAVNTLAEFVSSH